MAPAAPRCADTLEIWKHVQHSRRCGHARELATSEDSTVRRSSSTAPHCVYTEQQLFSTRSAPMKLGRSDRLTVISVPSNLSVMSVREKCAAREGRWLDMTIGRPRIIADRCRDWKADWSRRLIQRCRAADLKVFQCLRLSGHRHLAAAHE